MSDHTSLAVLEAAVHALQAGAACAMLTVVQTTGSAPRHIGARMVLLGDGSTVGTIGGGTLEERALADARQALTEGRSRLQRYDLTGATGESLGLCGGTVDVSIEVLTPPPRLLLIGGGHITQALATMAGVIGMDVYVVDDREEWASRQRFPMVKAVHVVAYDPATETLDPLPVSITPATAVVVATWGWDEPALRQVLKTPAFYIGLVASRRKLQLIGERLQQHGIPAESIERIHAPAGLDLGGDSPGDIALSILAEIQMVHHGASGTPLHQRRRASAPPTRPMD